MLADLHSREELVEVGGDDVFQGHVTLIADFDEARKKWWNFDSREEFGARRGISNHDGEIQRQATDVGERVRRIDSEGSQDGEDLVVEETIHLRFLGWREFFPAQEIDSRRLQIGSNVDPKDVRLAELKFVRPSPDSFQDFSRRETAGGSYGDAGCDPPFESGHPNHEELIQVAGEDRQELGAFQQREFRVLAEFENPLVEGEPGEFSIEEAVVGKIGLGAEGQGSIL